MTKTKSRLSIALAIMLVFTMLFSTTAFAATESTDATNYGYSWYNKGSGRQGSFTVAGTGSRCDMTLKVEDFSTATYVEIEVYNGSTLITTVSSWIGTGLSTGGQDELKLVRVAGASTYTLRYQILSTDSSGRVMAWTY